MTCTVVSAGTGRFVVARLWGKVKLIRKYITKGISIKYHWDGAGLGVLYGDVGGVGYWYSDGGGGGSQGSV